ncbi:hypothetical protein HYN48_12360 [Flavobacterium magnum]|uniref:Secretion system C-terminal sorting domain-containing protein n=1 Tax=Flavobacterium magnum TaxID=2162713 RepID=A0A2S0RHW6_9FLAO|nr:T9SS type A sorting domain-containing protein [Flavobacterium magnum]AWA30808.1 hypothetical protein HYN48_12360 [Flavobacterium magnum]
MRKIYALLCLATAGYGQQNINFETGGQGANYTWNVFENDSNPALEFVDNPNPSGINISPTVAKFTTLITGMPYAGTETQHGNMGTFTLDADHATIKIMVYKSVISDVGIKLVQPGNGAQPEIKVSNTVINQWEELSFNFSAQVGTTFDQIVVFPDFSGSPRTYGCVTYFDNITFGMAEAQPQPLTAAPTPVLPQAQVISMFSDAYQDVPVDTWRTAWSDAVLQDLAIDGNPTKRYTNLNFVGIETIASQIDATQMDYFNVDVWSPDFTIFKIKLVDFGPNAIYDGGGDDSEHEITFNNPQQGSWITYSIPLTDFANLQHRDHISQLIFVGGNKTVYVDNVYFSRAELQAADPQTPEFSMYPNPVKDQLHILNPSGIDQIRICNIHGQLLYQSDTPAGDVEINTQFLTAGTYFITVNSGGKTAVKKFIKQ